MTAAALVAEDVSVDYRRDSVLVRAVRNVSLAVHPGEVLCVVGESGCGKSSLGRALVGLEPTATGTVTFRGEPVSAMTRAARRASLRGLQMVFQDPYASLNPRRRLGDLVGEAAVLRGAPKRAAREQAVELIERVGLPADAADKYPHEFSGGQRQRLAIARALAADPACVIADEPISALDASAQAHVANLLTGLVRERRMGMVFISHDLSVVRQIADRVAVMYLGAVVEVGPLDAVWAAPVHPYTAALVASIPRADGSGVLPTDLPGDVPDPANPPPGCVFHPRCPIAVAACAQQVPVLEPSTSTHAAACLVRKVTANEE